MVYYKKRKVVRKKRFVKKSRPAFKSSVPRTLQIATKRNMNMKLKFVVNQTYVLDPTVMTAGQTAFLCFRANSIFHSQIPVATVTGLWASQDPLKYSNLSSALITQNADGWNEWTDRFQHFTVSGSRITSTFEPAGSGVPCIMTTHLSGVQGAIQATTTAARLNSLPYIKRSSIVSQGITVPNANGTRQSMNYSARQFEGVTDPNDNSNLRGRFANSLITPPTVGLAPTEQSFFYVSLTPIDPGTTGTMPKGVIRTKLEYIVSLREPTESNQIQLSTNTAASHDNEL